MKMIVLLIFVDDTDLHVRVRDISPKVPGKQLAQQEAELMHGGLLV
jgi:hypothetical protein